MYFKKIIILIFVLFLIPVAFVVVSSTNTFSAFARRASFEVDRTRYMSDILRITNGVMPVLWISPKYSYESASKYFDLSGNGNHATQSTADYQPAVNPPGLSFDGGNDYLEVDNTDTELDMLSHDLTAEAWIYYTGDFLDEYSIVGVGGVGGNNGWGYYIDNLNEHIIFEVATVAGRCYPAYTGITTNVWHYIVASAKWNGSNIEVTRWVDGVDQGTTVCANPGNVTSTQNWFRIGGDSWLYFSGSIDEVRIYNIALSAAQIQNLYLAGLPMHR